MTTQIKVTVSFDKILNDMPAETLLKLKEAIEIKLQSFAQINKPVEEIHIGEVFSQRVYSSLRVLDITYLSDLRKYTQKDLAKLRNIGSKALKEIQQVRIKYNV